MRITESLYIENNKSGYQVVCSDCETSVADPGGGGSRGSGPPPLLGHDVGFLTLGPKLDPLLTPPPFFLLVDLRWPPLKQSWILPWTYRLYKHGLTRSDCTHTQVSYTVTRVYPVALTSNSLTEKALRSRVCQRTKIHDLSCRSIKPD